MNCLCCHRPLLPTENADAGWHQRCTRAFFGTDSVPSLEITNDQLTELARESVIAGRTVAGVQRKLSVHLSGAESPTRLTLVGYPAGYILKPATPDYPELPEIEHLTMSLAGIVDVATVPFALIPLQDGTLAYITRRVDRRKSAPWGIPMEDLCQLSQRLTEDKYRSSCEQA
ncbi:MAG: type II toxin-antitoxin system HipA family toxin, partial [Spirochaetaceae bacterium]